MKNKPAIKQPVFEMPRYKLARLPLMFDNIKIFDKSEETVFNEVYVTGVLENNRVVRFKKSTLEYIA